MSTSSIENDSIKVSGEMTIIGETVELTWPVSIIQGEKGVLIKSKMKIDRTKFGIYHNNSSFMKRMKEKMVAEEFEIEFNIVFN